MSQNEVVGIDIVARLDDFRAELAKIPDIGGKEAKALTSQLSREIKKATTASKRTAAQSKKTAEAFKKQAKATKEVSEATSKTNETLKKLGTAVVSIELLKQAFELVKNAIAGTLERAQRLDAEMGGNLTPTITEASAAFSDLKDSAVEPLIPFITTLAGGFADTAKGAELAMRALFGLTDATAELRAQRALEDGAIDKQSERIEHLKFQYRQLAGAEQEAAQLMGVDAEATPAMAKLTDEIARQVGTLRRLRGEVNLDREARRAASVANLEGAKKDTESTLTRTRIVVDAIQRERAAIVDIDATRRASYIESANARQAAADRSIADEERVVAAQKQAIVDVSTARRAAAEEERSLRSSLAITAIETASNVANSIIDGLEQVLLANVQEAKKRRDIELGLAILRGELQAAAAFGTTLATYGATPQGFALAAAAAAAVGISSKAAAGAAHAGSAEHFHSGGLASDEGTAILRAGEGVLTPAAVSAVGGERGLRDLNANAGAGGDGGQRTLQIGARAFDALVSQSLTSKGSVLTRSLAALRARPGGYRVHG